MLSVDTYKAATARAALAAGTEIINDVSGLTWDPALPAVCAEARCGVILMHTRGRPDQWRTQSQLDPDSLIETVRSGLAASLSTAANAGIPPDHIVLDPGYGFGKRLNENFSLLSRQSELLSLRRPILAGLSRKSFLGHALAPLYNGEPAPCLSARAHFRLHRCPRRLPSFTEHPSSPPQHPPRPRSRPHRRCPPHRELIFRSPYARSWGDEASSTSVIRSNPPPGRVPPGSGF